MDGCTGGPAFFAYSTNYLIDLQAGIIVDVEATPANQSQEVESTRTMIDRVERQRDLKPRRLVGDNEVLLCIDLHGQAHIFVAR